LPRFLVLIVVLVLGYSGDFEGEDDDGNEEGRSLQYFQRLSWGTEE
jgi:hypothetical protein